MGGFGGGIVFILKKSGTTKLKWSLLCWLQLQVCKTYSSQQSTIRHKSPCSYKGQTPSSKGGTVHKLLWIWQQPLNAQLHNKQ